MKGRLQEVSIHGLHDRLDVTIPIKDNRLVLVGVNGLGKTTVVNVLYYFLSQQWQRLSEFRFDEIAIRLGRRKLRVTQEMLIKPTKSARGLLKRLPPPIRKRILGNPRYKHYLARGELRRLEEELDMPYRYLTRRFDDIHHLDWQVSLFDNTENSPLSDIANYLDKFISSQILYLPTYRRIEQDLRALLPHFDEDIREVVSRQIRPRRTEHSFVELVQFGMEDVQDRILSRMNELKEQARVELNELAGSCLRDVISGDAERYKRSDIEALDESEVDRILSRVEEKTLPADDKERLRHVIRGIRQEDVQQESPRERYLAHFFSKLVEMYRSQQERSTPLHEFVRVCNQYLQGKHIEFDDSEYTFSIYTDDHVGIEMGHLSSGEKQIVSLFSHIYLGDADSFTIIIDEPELSLSVDWQKRLLPDLARSNRCSFLAAVTHSPFIFDNEFDQYATDLRACTTIR